MLFSVEQAFVERDEKRAPLKTPAWEATFAWGCVLGPDTFSAPIRDYWPVDQRHLHINVKEAWALANALDAFSGYCVIVGWMFILIARFLSHPGGVKAQSLQTWSSP